MKQVAERDVILRELCKQMEGLNLELRDVRAEVGKIGGEVIAVTSAGPRKRKKREEVPNLTSEILPQAEAGEDGVGSSSGRSSGSSQHTLSGFSTSTTSVIPVNAHDALKTGATELSDVTLIINTTNVRKVFVQWYEESLYDASRVKETTICTSLQSKIKKVVIYMQGQVANDRLAILAKPPRRDSQGFPICQNLLEDIAKAAEESMIKNLTPLYNLQKKEERDRAMEKNLLKNPGSLHSKKKGPRKPSATPAITWSISTVARVISWHERQQVIYKHTILYVVLIIF